MSRRLRNNEQKQTLGEHENVVTQILYQYDRNDRLCREYTAHEVAVDVDSTPFIEYGYDSVQNGLKPISLTYPSGKEISYGYDFAGRVTTISDGILLRSGDTGGSGSGSGSGGPVLPPVIEEDVIVRYAYRGWPSCPGSLAVPSEISARTENGKK